MEQQRIEIDDFDTRPASEEGVEITLTAPSGAELKGFRVRGYDSRSYQAKASDQNRRLLKLGQRRKTPTVQELEEESLQLAATLVAGWPGNLTLKREPFPYTHENAVALLRAWPWARQQIEEVARERANFLPKSSASSSSTAATSAS